ncbi:MAG: adenylate/guanylate cyclase domain-containing protein, partial [Kofleriaceae bacterium]|nr:adenylate/guanylate cyclase domain-containing protein [Kofleriaceae bacterium]
TRRIPLAILYGDSAYMPMGLAVALAERGGNDARYVAGQDHVFAAGRELPLGPRAAAHLDFLGRDRSFPRISAAAVLRGEVPPAALADKLVFVGLTYGAYDKVATPFDQLTDGVELHATLAHNILHGELLRPTGRGTTLLVIAALGALITLMQLRRLRRRPWVPMVVAAALSLGWLVVAQLAFSHARVVLDVVAPTASGLLIAATGAIAVLATEGREKARLRAAFSQYVSSTLVERVLANPELAHLGGERRELTVLFSDIRGFSRLAETLAPEELAAFLNGYLTPMSALVLDSQGTLDKYIGDAVMAIWGAPLDVADHATRACATALAMQATLVDLNATWRRDGLPTIAIGVGINTGPMAVGNMGSEARFDYTVLGDAVNLGARLEALTKEYEADILCGEATARAAGDGFVFRELDWVRVKGRGGTAAVFELVGRRGAARLDDAALATWADGLAAYRARDFDRAVERWGDLALRYPDDGVTAVMRARAEALRAAPPPGDWDGVYEQHSK